MTTPALIPLDQVDPQWIEDLLDRAFEPGRQQRTAYKVREGMDWLPTLSFAALDADEHLVGTIQCWPVALTTPEESICTLPVSAWRKEPIPAFNKQPAVFF